MKINYFKMLIVISCLFLSISANAYEYDFEAGGIYYTITSETKLTVKVTYKHLLDENLYSGNITIPSMVTFENRNYKVTEIGVFAFYRCNGLYSVSIPNSVTTISTTAFAENASLNRYIVDEGNPAFATKDGVLFNKNFTELRQCPNMKSSEYTIPDGVEIIGDKAFRNCSGLTSATIPNSVRTIGEWAFFDCNKLTSITIPNSVNTIGNNAFSLCTGLASVTLGNNITSIGSSVFGGCSALAKVYSLNSVAPAISDQDLPFEESAYASATLFIPIGSLGSYSSKTGWKEFVNIVEVDFSSIENANNDNVKVVTRGNEIIVNGIDENMLIEIYNMKGEQIYKGYDNTTAINTCGLYLVRIAEKTYKVIL